MFIARLHLWRLFKAFTSLGAKSDTVVFENSSHSRLNLYGKVEENVKTISSEDFGNTGQSFLYHINFKYK